MLNRLSPFALAGCVIVAAPAPASAPGDEMLDRARAAAREDRHADAIDGFRQVLSLRPDLPVSVRIELADQLTWAQRFDEAIPLYSEAAASPDRGDALAALVGLGRVQSWAGRHTRAVAAFDRALVLDPGNVEARLLRAQTLGWAGRLLAARKAYDDVLNDDPANSRAIAGRARVLSWRGRHREAVAALSRAGGTPAGASEETVIVAESQQWMGRPDKALATLDQALRVAPEAAGLRARREQILRGSQPVARFDIRLFDQSDDLEIAEAAAEARFPIEHGRGVAVLRFTRGEFRPKGSGSSRIIVQRPQVVGAYRLSDAVELNGSLAVDFIDARGAAKDRAPLTFETYATVRPDDVWRFDAGISRWTFDSEAALRSGLTATQFSLSSDIRPDEAILGAVRFTRARYSDGNRRNWWQVEASRRLLQRPRLVAAYRFTAFGFRFPGREGYYSPRRYRSHDLTLSGSGAVSRSLTWEFRLTGGYETERPGRSRWTVNAGAGLAYRLSPRFEMETAYDFSSSRTSSNGGFERGIARLTLRRRF